MTCCLCVCVDTLLMVSRSDDHRADEPKAAARPSEGAVLPTSLHAGAGAHRRPAAPGVVGTSPRLLHRLSLCFKGTLHPNLKIHHPLLRPQARSGVHVLLDEINKNLRTSVFICATWELESDTTERVLLKLILSSSACTRLSPCTCFRQGGC